MKGTNLPSVRLGEIAEFRNGINYNKDNFGKGLKVVNVKDFQDRLIADLSDLEEVNPDGVFREECLLKDDDIIFVRSNGNRELIGRSMFVKGVTEPVSHSAFSIKVRFSAKGVLPRFYAYVFRTALIRTELSNRGGGTNISNLNQDILNSLEVPKPSLETQCKIASILSAYDDLIENNTRHIGILESMAQAIYREWFVEFRFPGHEKVRFVDSPVGKIPNGWKPVKIEDTIFVNPRTTVPREGEKPFVSMGAVPHNTMLIDVAATEMRTGNSGSKFKNDDTLFARITPCLENGKTAFVQFLPTPDAVAFGSTEFIVLRSKTVCPEFVYLLARSDAFRDNAIKSMSGATGRQRVQEKCFDNFVFAHPDPRSLSAFADFMQPLFRNVFACSKKNANLRKTRDLLLPKLISGQLDVEDLDIETGEAVLATK